MGVEYKDGSFHELKSYKTIAEAAKEQGLGEGFESGDRISIDHYTYQNESYRMVKAYVTDANGSKTSIGTSLTYQDGQWTDGSRVFAQGDQVYLIVNKIGTVHFVDESLNEIAPAVQYTLPENGNEAYLQIPISNYEYSGTTYLVRGSQNVGSGMKIGESLTPTTDGQQKATVNTWQYQIKDKNSSKENTSEYFLDNDKVYVVYKKTAASTKKGIHYVTGISDSGSSPISDVSGFVADIPAADVSKPNDPGNGGITIGNQNVFYDLRKDSNEDGNPPHVSLLADAGYEFANAYIVKDGDLKNRVRIVPVLAKWGLQGFGQDIVIVYKYKILGGDTYYDYNPSVDEIYVEYHKISTGGKVHFGVETDGYFQELKQYNTVTAMEEDQHNWKRNDSVPYDDLDITGYDQWDDNHKNLEDRYIYVSGYVKTADGQKINLNKNTHSLRFTPETGKWTYLDTDGNRHELKDTDDLYVTVNKTGYIRYGYLDESGNFQEIPNVGQSFSLPTGEEYQRYSSHPSSILQDIDYDGAMYEYDNKTYLVRAPKDNINATGDYSDKTSIDPQLTAYDTGSIYSWEYSGAGSGVFMHNDTIYVIYKRVDPKPVDPVTVQLGEPEHHKWLLENTDSGKADGSYTLNLSLEGNQAETSTTKIKSDIVIIVDESSSMNRGTRVNDEKEALLKLSAQIFSDGDNTVHIIPFGTVVGKQETFKSQKTFDDWIKSFQPFSSNDDAGNTNWQDALQKAQKVLSGLDTNKSVIFISDGEPTVRNDKEPQPTFWNWGTTYWYAPVRESAVEDRLTRNYNVYGSGMTYDQNTGRCYNAAKKDAYKLVHETGAEFFSVSVFDEANSKMQTLANYAYNGNDDMKAPDGRYLQGNDADSIARALSKAYQTSVRKYQYSNFKITDQIAHDLTATFADITTVAGSVEDNGRGNPVNTNAIQNLKNAINNGTASIDFEYWYYKQDPNNPVKEVDELKTLDRNSGWTKWTEAKGAPKAHYDVNTHTITWDLSTIKNSIDLDGDGKNDIEVVKAGSGTRVVLPKNVIFKVTCTVWPNQKAYDRVKEIKLHNGSDTDYAAGYQSNKYAYGGQDVDKDIKETDGEYQIYSNEKSSVTGNPERSAKLEYTPIEMDQDAYVRDYDASPVDYERPVMDVHPAELDIQKLWKEKKDSPGYMDGNDSRLKDYSVTVKVYQSKGDNPVNAQDPDLYSDKGTEELYATVTLNQANNWQHTLKISPGLYSNYARKRLNSYYGLNLLGTYNGKTVGVALNPGHEYRADEDVISSIKKSNSPKFELIDVQVNGNSVGTGYNRNHAVRLVYWEGSAQYFWDCSDVPEEVSGGLKYVFVNAPEDLPKLPNTGGGGTAAVTLAAFGLLGLGTLLLTMRKRLDRKRALKNHK